MLLADTSYGKIPQAQAQSQAKLYLDKALELNNDLAEAWAGLGLYYNGPPPQADKGIPALEKALAIKPNLIDAANWLVLLYWFTNQPGESMALLNDITVRDPLYKPAFGNRVYQLSMMGRADEARAYIDRVEFFMADAEQILQTRAWVDYSEGKVATGLERMQAVLKKQPNDRVFKVGVNEGHYRTQQFDEIFDDNWSNYYTRALFNLGRNEEAYIVAMENAADGIVQPLFSLLNATDQSDALIRYLEDHWPDLEAFEQSVPATIFGYYEMADIALAYRRTGNQALFDEAMRRLDAANQQSLSHGIKSNDLQFLLAAHHAMAGANDLALARLAEAIDNGLIVSSKISNEYPCFRELDGNPEYEAIQARMIEHLNSERQRLGLLPIPAST